MTKQEKIQEVYGEYFEKCKPNKNGMSLINESDYPNIDWKDDGFGYNIPKSLKGIENNNGWVKIESEDDLPKESGVYEACINEEYIGRIKFSKEFNEWSCIYDSDNLRFPTHYQPIIKPLLPIY